MKKTRLIPLALLCVLCLAAALLIGCDKGGGETPTGTDVPTEAPTEPATEPDTEAPTEAPTEPETEKETRQEMDIFGNSYNANMLVGFDEQGHLVDAVSARKEDHEVGIFYFIWLGQHGASKIYNVDDIRTQYGDEITFHKDVKESPAGQFHWWGEPLFGYYNSGDEWVIRKHLEMLTDAGVDFLVFDTTNAVTYDSPALKIMRIVSELREEGWDCPQVAYYTHSYSIQTMTHLYNEIYKKEKYPDAWYRVDGKPFIIGYTKEADDIAATGASNYKPGDLNQEMRDFFYIREARWPFDPVVKNAWPYTEWKWPQPINTDMISVSIATHPGVPFSFSLTHEGWMNWGRGYDVKKGVNVHDDIMKGTFYDSEWKTVYRADPKFVFVTGWNEWVSIKSWYEGEYMYCDNVDMEYSRDAEPMKGGYEDAYFIQTIQNIRKYKYEPLGNLLASVVRKTIDVTGAVNQWDDVNAVYRRVGTDDGARNNIGGATTIRFSNDPVRNNILEVRVTNDADNVYFFIKTDKDIVKADTSDWMNIFIGKGRPEMGKGWEGYEFVLNRSFEDGQSVVEKLNADYSGEKVGTASCTVNGNVMQVSVPRALLGLDGECDLYFKAADAVNEPAEIMNYYASGRSLPMGRLSYLYQFDK